MLNRAGKRKVADLGNRDIDGIANLFLNDCLVDKIRAAVNIRAPNLLDSVKEHYFYKNKWIELCKLSSKQLRDNLSDPYPINIYKCGLILTTSECLGWLKTVNKLSSTAHKNSLLRFLHGDVYSKDRLFRFGLSDSPLCEHCGGIETVNHRIYECDYTKLIWQAIANCTGNNQISSEIEFITGSYAECSTAALTLHAELIGRLIRNQNLTQINAETLVKTMARTLIKKEVKPEIKRELDNLFIEGR